jgi:aryl carrier-like protein
LPELEYQFVDWSEWQNIQEESTVNMDYWETRLFGVKTMSPLIIGNIADNAIEAEYLSAKISEEQFRQIELQCNDLSTTPFEWFLTCLGLLISKYQNHDEIWISTPWANRSEEEFFETVGCFVDTIPLRMQVNSKLSFQELMTQIKGQVRSDFSHADQSGEIIRRLLRESLPSTVTAQPAILFAYQISLPKINFGQEIEANAIPVENKSAKYDFTFRIEPNNLNNSAQIIFEYRKNIITLSDAEHLLADYLKIISIFAIDFKKDPTKFIFQFEVPKQIRFTQNVTHVDIELKNQTYTSSLQLAKIWGQLLGQDVNPADNFFTLGGDSILALRLISHLREDGILCKPRDIFENPTPESFANHLILKKIGADKAQSMDANEHSRYLLPIEKWFFDLNLINHNHWYQALSLNIPTGLDVNTLSKALNLVHTKHQAFSYRWKKDDLGIEFFIQNDSLFNGNLLIEALADFH